MQDDLYINNFNQYILGGGKANARSAPGSASGRDRYNQSWSKRTEMNEEDFDSSRDWLPFGTKEAMEAKARLGRTASLAAALWGRAPEDLERQLLPRCPEIPQGFDLADFRILHQSAQSLLAVLRAPGKTWAPSYFKRSAPAILVGVQRFTVWEARCEIARRAIEYLEKPR